MSNGWAWATLDASAPWLEIDRDVVLPGMGVQTVAIPPEEAGGFILYVDLPDDLCGVSPAAVAAMSDTRRAELRIQAFAETDPPAGVKVTGKALVDQDGAPVRAWLTEVFDAGEVAAQKDAVVAAVMAERQRRICAVKPLAELLVALAAGGDALTAGEAAAVTAIDAAATAIVAAAPDDAESLAAFPVADNEGWPA